MTTIETPATAEAEPERASFSLTIPVFYTDLLTNCLVGALEGGSNYWLNSYEYATPRDGFEAPAYADEKFWMTGGRVKLTFDDPEDGDEAQKTMEIGFDDLQRGAAIMAQKFGKHFGDLVAENDDAITHDVFIQCVLFEDIIYG